MKGSSQELNDFIHCLSHDVKNVLHNIQGYVDLLVTEQSPECVSGIARLVRKGEAIVDAYVRIAESGRLSERPDA
jgi:light-regulated signal transduction histidine kinase (bacteriophytochrome)